MLYEILAGKASQSNSRIFEPHGKLAMHNRMGKKRRHLKLVDETVEVEADTAEQLLDELVALTGDAGDLGDVGADLGLDNAEAVFGLLPLLRLRQVQLQEAPQLIGHDSWPRERKRQSPGQKSEQNHLAASLRV